MTVKHSTATIPLSHKAKQIPVRWFVLGAFLLIMVWLGLKTWRMVEAAQSLQTRQEKNDSIGGVISQSVEEIGNGR
jgi:hypothetical protein